MIKKFLKDNRGQVLYAVLVAIMAMGVLSMIAMGLTLKNYHAAVQKQEQVADFYAADAVAELIRTGKYDEEIKAYWGAEVNVDESGVYTITCDTVTIIAKISDNVFTSWEVRYHAKQSE